MVLIHDTIPMYVAPPYAHLLGPYSTLGHLLVNIWFPSAGRGGVSTHDELSDDDSEDSSDSPGPSSGES